MTSRTSYGFRACWNFLRATKYLIFLIALIAFLCASVSLESGRERGVQSSVRALDSINRGPRERSSREQVDDDALSLSLFFPSAHSESTFVIYPYPNEGDRVAGGVLPAKKGQRALTLLPAVPSTPPPPISRYQSTRIASSVGDGLRNLRERRGRVCEREIDSASLRESRIFAQLNFPGRSRGETATRYSSFSSRSYGQEITDKT